MISRVAVEVNYVQQKLRCLIVDDSALSRKIVRAAVEAIEGTEVVATCHDGRQAVARAVDLHPDLIAMDLEMPLMNGIEAVRELRTRVPDAKVLMVSSFTSQSAKATNEALQAGALDFVIKPPSSNVPEAVADLAEQLSPKLELVRTLQQRHDQHPNAVEVSLEATQRAHRTEAVCIGVSTGGPSALCQLLPQIPEDFPVPVFVVQHMPPMFTKSLAHDLDAVCPLKVIEAHDGMIAEAGKIYIAPGGKQMKVESSWIRTCIRVTDDPAESNARPSVNYMFRSAVSVYRDGLVGVILTGMGQDGLQGCELVNQAGGFVLTQDADSSVVYGMPRAVAEAGLSNQVATLDEIATALKRLAVVEAIGCR